MPSKKAVIYFRDVANSQGASSQRLELREAAKRFEWELVAEISDDGTKGGNDRLVEMTERQGIDVIMVQSIHHLGRSVADLISWVAKVRAARVDLYAEEQGIDPQNCSMIFDTFAALERLQTEAKGARIKEAMARSKANGRRPGRPSVVSPAVATAVGLLHKNGLSIRQIASQLKIGNSTTQRIIASMPSGPSI